MENLTVTITGDKIKQALDNAANELFKSSYSNPIKDLLEKAVKEQEGKIKEIVDEIIAASISNPEFKEKISQVVITRIVEAALTKK